jgi:5,10-methylene-tetrahydrofolate dehydrogenase/Methenyl tetrahydrofolate cyclohydrolase
MTILDNGRVKIPNFAGLNMRQVAELIQQGRLALVPHATVTICHSRTVNLPLILRDADIIVAAIGVPNFVKADMVKESSVIIDVGINATDEGIVGDVEENANAKASAFTPVPGGIGVISNAMVMETLTRNL